MNAAPRPQARPRLARGVRLRRDQLTGQMLLLRPEQGFELRGAAADVVKLCTGELTIAAINDRLTTTHREASRSQIEADVTLLLVDLSRRGLIVFEEP